MATNIAIQSLMNEREKLITEKTLAVNQFDDQIRELETAIDSLTGKKVWEIEAEMVYDDERADYIKGSIEN